MGIINYDVDTANQLEDLQAAPPPNGELSLNYMKRANPELFEGLGKLSETFSIALNPSVKPVQAPPHRYAAPKLPIIKEALDKLIHTGQVVRVNQPTPWISNMVVRERPAKRPTNLPKLEFAWTHPKQSIRLLLDQSTPYLPLKKTSIVFIKQRSSRSLTARMRFKPLN